MALIYSSFNQMIVKQIKQKERFAASPNSCDNLYEIV